MKRRGLMFWLFSGLTFFGADRLILAGGPNPPDRPEVECTAVHSLEDDLFGYTERKSILDVIADETIHFHVPKAKNVPCRKRPPSTLESRKAFLDQWSKRSGKPVVKSKSIRGVQFEDERPELLEAFRDLTRELDRYDHPAMPEEMEPPLRVDPSCKKVQCALAELLGPARGERVLHLYAQYGVLTSHYISHDGKKLSEAELESIEAGFSDLPPGYLPEGKNLPIRKEGGGGFSLIANARITLYGAWSAENKEDRAQTILHEMGHRVANSGNRDLDHSLEWLRVSGWTVKPSSVLEDHPSVFTDYEWTGDRPVSGYAGTNPAEDFAESVVAYRINPERLKKRSPERYQWLKEAIFGGLEYTHELGCSENANYMAKNRDKLRAPLLKLTASRGTESETQILDACMQSWIAGWDISNPKEIASEKLDQCLDRMALETAMGTFAYTDASLKFPYQMIQSASRMGGLEDFVSPEDAAAIRSSLRSALRGRVASEMGQFLEDRAKQRDQYVDMGVALNHFSDPKVFCEEESEYVYQNLELVTPGYAKKDRAEMTIFEYREKLSEFMNSGCQAWIEARDSAKAQKSASLSAEDFFLSRM